MYLWFKLNLDLTCDEANKKIIIVIIIIICTFLSCHTVLTLVSPEVATSQTRSALLFVVSFTKTLHFSDF